jgi:hypothetical protein
MLCAFNMLMLRGKDVRLGPLEKRRGQLQQIVKQLPDTIRYSENFNVPIADLRLEVRKGQLEGIVAKRMGVSTARANAAATGSSSGQIADKSLCSAVTFRKAACSIQSWSGISKAI